MKSGSGGYAQQPINTRQGQSQEDSSLMNVFPHFRSLGNSTSLRNALIPILFLLPVVLPAQEVPYTAPGIISLGAALPVYNGKYAIKKTDFGFLWLDTTSLQPGLVQVEAKCGTGQPPSDTGIYVIGDCNGISNVSTSGTLVVGRQFSGQCGAAIVGCNGGRTNGTGTFFFRLGTWEFLGQDNQPDIVDSTQTADQQGRTWNVQALDTGGRNFKWVASNPNGPPTALATATNLSAAGRADKTNYYGDKWRLADVSTPVGSITRIDWDFIYNASFAADETGIPADEGSVTGYFPCDPNGLAQGNIRTGASCIQSLGLTNPPVSKPYRFAMQSASANGTSTNPFLSATVTPACPQASITGYAGFAGTCVKTAGTLNVLTGGNADASGSSGNILEASFNWDFTGSNPISVSGANVTVPAGATGFTLTITYPGGYQATAAGTIVVSNLVAAFSLAPNPVLLNGQLTLTNQMQKAAATTLDSVDYLINPGVCGTPPAITTNPVGGTFISGGTATVPSNAPSNGTYCAYLKYSFTPQGQAQQTQTVSNAFTATDWQAAPLIQISPLPICGTSLCAQIGTQYSLSDVETFPVGLTHPAAQWDLSGTPIGTSADASVPISWTPSSPCSSCTLRVSVNGFTATLPVTVSSPVPTPTPTPPPSGTPTPTPTPPPGGSISVSVSGPASGSRGQTLSYTATVSGGSPPYTYQWQCDYNPLGGFTPGQQTQTCSWSTAGTHNVVALVRDGFGSSNLNNPPFTVTITGIPGPSSANTVTGPTLTINQFNGRYSASNGSPITFTATETHAASYSWNFGDGSPLATTKSAAKTYTTAGSHVITLTVTGDEINTSGTASTTINLDITGPPPPSVAYAVAGAAQTGADAYEIEALKTVSLTASETKAISWTWDFGDGTQGTGQSVNKAWSGPGSRTVTLTVTGNGTDTAGSSHATIAFNVTPVKFKAVIVPGAAHLDLGASVWGTDVSVTNPGSDTLTITPNFVPYLDGTPDTFDLSQIRYDSSLSFQLAAGASWSQVDIVKFLNGGSSKGTLVFKYEGASDPVVTARVYFASASDPQGPSYGAAFPSYLITGGGGLSTQGTQEAVTTEQTLIGLRSDNLYRFRVTLFNADSKAGTFRLSAYDQSNNKQLMKDASGQLVGFREFRIGPYQQAAPNDQDLGLCFGGAGCVAKDASTRYVLKASRAPNTSAGTIIAFGTALDRKTNDLVQIADDTPSTVAESGVISYYVAGVSHLDTQRAQWRTDLRIFNKSSSPRVLGFEYYFTKGAGTLEQKAQVVNVPIAANGLLTFDDVVDSLMKQDPATDLTGDTAGMLRILHFEDPDSSSNPLVISSRNYDDPSDGFGTAGTQLAVYSSSQTTKPGNPALVMPGAENSERFYSVIGLFAADATPTTGRVSAVGADGNEVGFFDFALNQPGGIGRFGQLFLTALKDPANPASPATIPPTPVTIRVTVTQGARVGGYAVTVDLKTNDLTFIQGRPLS
jgi:PKD repeat protein